MLRLILSLICSEDRVGTWEHDYEFRSGKY